MSYQPTLPYPKRWAVADVAYVREHYLSRSARQIAQDLNESVRRVQRLVARLKKSSGTIAGSALQNANAVQIVFSGGTSAANGGGSTCARVEPSNAPQALFSQPVDLAAFAAAKPVREVAAALKISRATAYRLAEGYWPRDSRALLDAWETYKGRCAHQTSGWFLRRVHPGGVVLHAGYRWSAHGLAVRVGQQLAVARSTDGLLAHTLDQPAQRFELSPIDEKEHVA